MKKCIVIIAILAFFACDIGNNTGNTGDTDNQNYVINPPNQTVFAVGSSNSTNDQKFDIAGFWATRDSADISVSCKLQWEDDSELKNGDDISATRRGIQTIRVILNSKIIGTFNISIITIEDFYGYWLKGEDAIDISDYRITDFNTESPYKNWSSDTNSSSTTKSDYPVGFDISYSSFFLHNDKQSFVYDNNIYFKSNNDPVSGLAKELAWLQINAQNGRNYTIEVNTDESISPSYLIYSGRTNIGITLKSTGMKYYIKPSSNGSLFTVGNGVTLTLDSNIALQGRNNNNASLVHVISGGTLIMNTGSDIAGNTIATSSGCGGGVYVEGTFTMNGGGISNNYINATSIAHGGGVYVTGGTFIMHGGKISGNSTKQFNDSKGGGVFVDTDGTFIMNAGEVSGNSISATSTSYMLYGGGVYVGKEGTFTMNGGKISGNSINAVDNGRSMNPGGGGVYVAGTFTMNDGEISSNRFNYESRYCIPWGGGVYNRGIFRITKGTIYGSNEGSNSNSATEGKALYGGGQYGIFNDSIWSSNGGLGTSDKTIRVVNGILLD